MKSIYLIFYLLASIFVGGITDASAQIQRSVPGGPIREVTFNFNLETDTLFSLPDQFIISGSELVIIDSVILKAGTDYRLNFRFGTLLILRSVLQSILGDSSSHKLEISYRSLPFSFKPSYSHREQLLVNDSLIGERIKIGKPTGTFSVDDIFGSGLQKSGSIVRGFSVGSNRDLSLNSGFRLQMAGSLTDDIDVIASLTDENSPIQPEGTTQTLQEVDKVFVELRGPAFSATMGDINLILSGNEFGNVNRKLSGAQGFANYKLGSFQGDLFLAGAVTRGKFTTNQFNGLDGVQGPYRLSGENNNRSIIIIAGTEHVYVNGEKITRGENADYIIDYANAEITFTPRRLIVRGSRIVVDFEYNDRQFNRSLLGAKAGVKLLKDGWQFNGMFIGESDNENSPVDIAINDSDKEILRTAGADRNKAVRSGVELVGIGKGQYLTLDTVVSVGAGIDSLITIYCFKPEDTVRAVYLVNFSDVGVGKGNYRKVSAGHYEFAGFRKGSYEPIRFLPMPQSHSLIDFDLAGQVTNSIKITGEYAVSTLNPNKLANNVLLNGSALKFGIKYSPDQIRIGGMRLGSLELNLKERFMEKQFLPMDRTNDVEFGRQWNLIDTLNQDENLMEGAIVYKPVQEISLSGGIGEMKKGTRFFTSRYSGGVQFTPEHLPKADYAIERILTRNNFAGTKSDWIRQKGTTQYLAGIFTPHLRISNEYLDNRGDAVDSMKQGSYRWTEIAPGISIRRQPDLFFNVDAGWQWNDSLSAGSLIRASNTFLNSYTAQWIPVNAFSTKIDFMFQQRKYSEDYKRKSNEDVDAILLRWLTKLNPLEKGIESEWYYEVESGRSSKLEKIFQRVPKGTGNYIYLGDVNNNHVVDQQDFQLSRFDGEYISYTLPTNELIPVTDLKASSRIRLTPSQFLDNQDWFSRIVSTLSSETYLRVEEKSTESDRKQIYLLNFNRFLDQQKTILGSDLITHDLYFMENNRFISLRYRYVQRNGLTQYAAQNEKAYMHENSIRLRWQLIQEISNQIDYSWKIDNLTVNQFSIRARNIHFQSLNSDWSYKPYQELELGFQSGFGSAANYDTTTADFNNQSVRLAYAFAEQGQVRTEFSREEVLLTRANNLIPFELTNGRIGGRSWLWKVNLEYRISKYLHLSAGYDGRSEGGRKPVHYGKAEVRAFF